MVVLHKAQVCRRSIIALLRTDMLDADLSPANEEPEGDLDISEDDLYAKDHRGWRHVHELPCDLCTGAQSDSISSQSASSPSMYAWSLSAEIIQMIVEQARDTCDSEWVTNPPRATWAAAVCKHWAHVCLRGGWTDKLKGREDVVALREIVSSPHSYLKHSITDFERMTYRLDRTDDPWLHLIPQVRQLLPNYKRDPDGSVTIVGPLTGGLTTMRSIHAYLPTQVPHSFSRGISHLSLLRISFHALSDLERLLSELPNLRLFKGDYLVWTSASTWPKHLLRRRARGSRRLTSPQMLLHQCSSNMEAVRLVTIPQDHWGFLRGILEALVANATHARIESQSRYVLRSAGDLPMNVLCEYTCSVQQNYCPRVVLIPPSDHIAFKAISPAFEIRVVQTWQQPNTPDPHTVALNIRFPKAPAAHTSIDWAIFEKGVTEYSQVQSIVFGRYRPHRQFVDGAWVPMVEEDVKFIFESLPALSAAGILSFMQPSPAMWEVSETQ